MVARVGVVAKLGVGTGLGRVVRLGVVAATLDMPGRLCVTAGLLRVGGSHTAGLTLELSPLVETHSATLGRCAFWALFRIN